MAEYRTDDQVTALIQEVKPLPNDLAILVPLLRQTKLGHKEAKYEVVGAQENEFAVMLRQSMYNVLDFSVILAYLPKTTNQVFRLRRYNGKSHEHTNRIEKVTFYGFHIHTATERYQRLDTERPEPYAEVTDRTATQAAQ